jgi:disulfide bond formation protein DsbB
VRVYQFRHTGNRVIYIVGSRPRPSDGLVSALRMRQLLWAPQRQDEAAMSQTSVMRMTWMDRLRAEPAGAAALAIFVLASAAILGAWYFEYVVNLHPCPLCLEQRIAYHIIIPLALLMTVAAFVHAPQKLLTVGFIAIIVAALANAVLGTYHAGVEWHFWAGPTDCTGPLSDLSAGGPLLDQLHSINVVRCDEAAWRFLGISLAGYNVLISLTLAAFACYGLFARKAAA